MISLICINNLIRVLIVLTFNHIIYVASKLKQAKKSENGAELSENGNKELKGYVINKYIEFLYTFSKTITSNYPNFIWIPEFSLKRSTLYFPFIWIKFEPKVIFKLWYLAILNQANSIAQFNTIRISKASLYKLKRHFTVYSHNSNRVFIIKLLFYWYIILNCHTFFEETHFRELLFLVNVVVYPILNLHFNSYIFKNGVILY